MRLLALVLLAAVACSPAVTPPTVPPLMESPRVSVAASAAPTPVPAASAPAAASAPGVATPQPATTETPTSSPTRAPATARPTAAPVAGPIHNEGQIIVADLPKGYSLFVGEAASAPAVTSGSHWSVNGTAITGADIRCTRRSSVGDLCVAVRIITDAIRLRNGAAYELSLDNDTIGSFVANGISVAVPHVVSLKATQFELLVQFDRPMLHSGNCGVPTGWTFTTPGTIEHVRDGATTSFPAGLAAYTSSSAAYGVFLAAFVSEANLSDDCTTIKFGSGWGGPTGAFDITVSGVQDMDGNPVQPRTFAVDVQDEGAPKLISAQLELQTVEKKVIRVAYSEAMDEDYVTDVEHYYLNGKLIPADTKIECELANCAWVRLTLSPSVFVYGSENTLTIVGVRDMAGNAMSPDIVTSGKFQVF